MPWFSTSSVDTWRHLRPEEQATVRAELEAWLLDAPRHLLRIRFADDANVPSCGFSFRFVDEARLARTGVLELAFPLEFPDQELLRLMVRLVRELPIRSGLGGYQAFFNDREKPTAFTAMRGWARRFVGLDIQDTDAMAFGAMTALPGVNWLTYVGPALLAPGEAEALAQRRWLTDATAVGLPRGVFLRAGERPSLGDLNRGEYPRAYLEVADAVRALFVEDPPTFYGSFETLDETRPWFRRFLEPDAWR